MATPTADEIKNNIQEQDAKVWDQAARRPDGLDRFENDLAKAIADAWTDVEKGLKIASVPVVGGTSLPGGSLTEGTATLSPGTLTSTTSFTSIAAKFSSSFPDGATSGLLALVDAIAQGIGQKFSLWVAGYSATLTASGGSCAWVAPTPANPGGTPGLWTGGSIQDFPLADGTSTGDTMMTANSLEAAIGSLANPEELKQNKNGTLQPALAAMVRAIAEGFETSWKQWKSNTKITGGSGSGTASPPSGSITAGAVTAPQIC